ncbi:flagellar biosynthesis protein FlhF [Colwelliaceae bacterium 6471]
MKIRRFVAKDMRTALAQIKEELGVEAVIMSNKKIAEGVELMAAVDNNAVVPEPTKTDKSELEPTAATQANELSTRDVQSDVVTLGGIPSLANSENAGLEATAPENRSDSLAALLNRKIQHAESSTPNGETLGEQAQNSNSDDIEQQFKSFTQRLQDSASVQAPNINESNQYVANASDQAVPYSAHETKSTNQAKNVVSSAEFQNMRKEMASIRQLLEHQMSGLMWQDMAQKDPTRAVLVNRLMDMGITDSLADQIAGYVPSHMKEEDAWEQAKGLMSQQLNTTNNDIVHRGGVVALVGPTGVGKTTTIAKLAARFAQIHGADNVAMISTDSYRIAGFEQLATYGRIIGCQVKLAKDHQGLDVLLQQFANKKLVLIDTAGMGQRDMRLTEHLTTLIGNARVRIRNYLVLSANTQQRVMQENVERFKKIPLAGCIYTKLDESLSVGEIISTSIQNGLPIGYLTDGQRVPEDIKVANTEKLVTLADKMANKINHNNSISWQVKPINSAAV